MKKVLLLSYYFPPLGMGGTQRIAAFARHLPDFGWKPTIITVGEIAYFAHDPEGALLPADCPIHRTQSLDPLRLLAKLRKERSLQGGDGAGGHTLRRLLKVANFFLLPDNKILWIPFAWWKANSLLKNEQFSAILTSGPPHSTHLPGIRLARKFSIPWIADFRDGWAGGDFQPESTSLHFRANRKLEKWVTTKANAVVTVTEGLAGAIRKDSPKQRILTITNGFEPQDFNIKVPEKDQFRVVHVGTVGNHVQPDTALAAFRKFLESPDVDASHVELIFVGVDLCATLKQKIADLDLTNHVTCTGYQPHAVAVQWLKRASVLLYLVQDSAGVGFIPGKTFEYIAAQKPVLALAKEIEGLQLLKKHTVVKRAAPRDVNAACALLLELYFNFRTPAAPKRRKTPYDIYSRKNLTARLAVLLDEISH